MKAGNRFSIGLSLVAFVTVAADLVRQHQDRQAIAIAAVAEFIARPGLWILPPGTTIAKPPCPPGSTPDLSLSAIVGVAKLLAQTSCVTSHQEPI